MRDALVLALFPGIDVLGLGFEREGFCVVRGPDVIFGGDIREFHPPIGVFDGVIGGDPCQSHSALANLVRAKGLEPSFPDMTPEFERIVNEARPRWFLRENVPKAPDVKPIGYAVRSFLLDHSTLDSGDGTGFEQMRKRRIWFGVQCDCLCDGAQARNERGICLRCKHFRDAPELRRFIRFALEVLPDRALWRERRAACVTGRHPGEIGATGGHKGNPPRYSLAEMLELQGLPPGFLDHAPWTMQGKRKAIGNAVALPMAVALARAVRMAMTPTVNG